MTTAIHPHALTTLWVAASVILGPHISAADRQKFSFDLSLIRREREMLTDDDSDSNGMLVDGEAYSAVPSTHIEVREEDPYYDPVFFKQFGIKIDVLFTRAITVDEDCQEKLESAWEQYKETFTLEPSAEDKRVARLFEACIHGSNADGDDLWTRKYGIEWLGKKVGYGLYAKEDYNPGDVIGYYAGYLTDSVQDHDYAFGFEGSSFEGLHIDGTLASNAMRYMNHTSEKFANVKAVEYYSDGLPFIMFVAKNAISRGKRLLYDYGEGYWLTKNVQPVALQP